MLLAKGADPNAREERQQTALMWAAAEGHAAVAAALLEAGADMHAKLESGFTSIFFAAREGHIGVVRTLLEAGADVNELLERVKGGPDPSVNNASYRPVDEGMGLLLLAVRNGHFELAVELVKAGADPNDQRSGFAPLHTMSWVRKPDKSDRGDPAPIGSGNLTSLEFVRELVKLGADVNLRLAEGAPRQPNSASSLNSAGATPFLLAADRSDVALMRLLLELGADPFIPNLDNSTALMAAAGLGTTSPEEEGGTEPEALVATRGCCSTWAPTSTRSTARATPLCTARRPAAFRRSCSCSPIAAPTFKSGTKRTTGAARRCSLPRATVRERLDGPRRRSRRS